MATQKTRKTKNVFECKLCNFNSVYECDINRHINTIKHKRNQCFIDQTNKKIIAKFESYKYKKD